MTVNHFGIVDYIVVGATLLFSLLIGVYYAVFKKQTNEDLLVGGRSMGAIPIAASMLVTYLSAITILGYPAEIYAYGIQIFMMTICALFYIPLSAYLFVSVFYKMKLTSVYEYLEMRFDSVLVRWLASFTFILQVVLINGVVLYAPSIALEAILGLPMWISIVGIGLCGTVYTSIGGLKAVVWTDVFQFVMIIIGMVSIVVKGFYTAGGISRAFHIASESGRLSLFDWNVDIFQRHNTLNFILGYGFSIVSLYGTHQPQVQRYCSLPTLQHAYRAIGVSIPMKVFTMGLVVLTGVSITATYAGCDPILLGHIKKPDQIVPYFVIKELVVMPGMMGLFVSVIFSAVLSTISSVLNSLAAVTWEDFLRRIPLFGNMTDRGQATTTRITSVIYGLICIGMAFVASNLGAIFQAAMTAVGATSGALGSVFFMGLFMPCINKFGAIIGMLAGLCSMMFIGVKSFILAKQYDFNPRLPTDLLQCDIETDFSRAINGTIYVAPDLEWPDKLYSLSYIMYSFVGALISISFALIFSLLTGGFGRCKNIPRKYLHPLLYRYTCCVNQVDERELSNGNQINSYSERYPSYKYDNIPHLQTGKV